MVRADTHVQIALSVVHTPPYIKPTSTHADNPQDQDANGSAHVVLRQRLRVHPEGGRGNHHRLWAHQPHDDVQDVVRPNHDDGCISQHGSSVGVRVTVPTPSIRHSWRQGNGSVRRHRAEHSKAAEVADSSSSSTAAEAKAYAKRQTPNAISLALTLRRQRHSRL